MAVVRKSGATTEGQHVTISYAGFNRPWAAWIEDRLRRHGHRVVLQRWDPPDETPLADALEDLLLAEGLVLLVLSDWYFGLGPRTNKEWNEALRTVVAPQAHRFAAVSVTTAALPTASTVLGAPELWGVGAREAERRLLERLGLDEAAPASSTTTGRGVRFPQDQPRVLGGVPRRNVRFTGREHTLNDLYRRLTQAESGTAAVTLLGMSGVGKTQVAAEYVHRFGSGYDVVWWVPADQRGTLRQRLAELAPALGLTTGPEYGERLRALRDALRRGEPYARWLLVLDGADQPGDIVDLLPSGPGHTLITSQNRSWGDHNTLLQEVSVYHREESVAFIRRRARRIETADAHRLAEALGDLPLALDQTAGALSDSVMSVDQYIERLDSGADLEGALKVSPDFPMSYYTAFSILLNRLRDDVPAAVDLLRLCTFFAPGPVPLRLLREIPGDDLPEHLAGLMDDPLSWNAALSKLVEYSVVRRDSPEAGEESGADGEALSMHRMVHQTLRAGMTERDQETFSQVVRQALTAANPRRPTDTRLWPRFSELVPHLEPSGLLHHTDPESQRLLFDCIRYLYLSGEYRAGVQLTEAVDRAWRAILPEDHPLLWDLQSQYATVLRATGDYARCERIDRASLAYMVERRGTRDLGVLRAVSGLAADLRGLGRYDEALEMSSRELAGYTELVGERDARCLNAQNNLAVSMRLLGRYTDALRLDRRTLELCREVLRPRHNWTLLSELSYGLDLRLLGRYEEAFSVQERCVELHHVVMGRDNPQTLQAELNLALCHHRSGDRDVAQQLLPRVLERLERVLGEESPASLQAAASYACAQREYGNLDLAREVGERTMHRYRAQLGPTHPFALGTTVNHALVLRAVGEREESHRQSEEALADLTGTLGPNHPWTLGSALNTAGARNVLGDVEGAAELSRDTAGRARATLGPTHPLTLSCQVALAADLRALRLSREAEELERESLDTLARSLGTQHIHTVSARSRTRPYWDIEPVSI